MVTTRIEHSLVLASCEHLARVHGFEFDYLPVDADGRVRANARPPHNATLLALGLANAEVGTSVTLRNLLTPHPATSTPSRPLPTSR